MASLASGRESSCLVVRVCGAVVILLVTGITIGGNVYVVVVHVALVAGHGLVCTSEGKFRLTVIEGRGYPRRRVMTHFTLLRESCLPVIGVVGLGVVRQMAGDTRRVRQFVISVDVALRTLQRRMRAGQSPSGLAVVELCPGPGRRAVASVAGSGESGLGMIWIRGAVVVLHVTGAASSTGQLVVPVHVALRARQTGVCSGERKARAGVIETRIAPIHRAVANLTGLRYPSLHVIRISGALVLLQVAGHAIRVGQFVVSIDVALRAGRRGVRPSKWEPSVGVVKARVGPRGRVVASGTGRRNTGLLVVRIRGAVVVLHVARSAVGTRQIEVSVEVALRTLQRGVCACQRKSHQAVIESRRLPRVGSVASLTGLGKIQSHMIRVCRLAKIRQVASDAIRRRALEFSSDVASRAGDGGMHPSQREPGGFQVIKVHSKPVVHPVALLACCRETRRQVAGAGRILIVGCVTGIALRRQSLELPSRRTLVA